MIMLCIALCSASASFALSEQELLEKGYRELKGEELRTMVSGNTEESSTGSFYYHTSAGTIKGKSGRSGKYFTGNWKMNSEGKLCRMWTNQYITSGCGILFINDETKDIQWLDADGKWYGTKFHTGNIKDY